MIYVTGDIHGWVTFDHVEQFAKSKGAHLTKDDYLIICGDIGILWNYKETGISVPANPKDKCWTEEELKLYDWLNAAPWTTLFVLGNHENYDRWETYPVSNWHGGRVQKVSDSIIHLMRGEIYEIEGKTIFTFGGAQSTDRGAIKGEEVARLSKGKWWWPQEIPNTDEINHAMENLAKYDDKIDYIITHDCPLNAKNILYLVRFSYYNIVRADKVSRILQFFDDIVDYKRWFCGHLHIDDIAERVVITYKDFYPIDYDPYGEIEKAFRGKEHITEC